MSAGKGIQHSEYNGSSSEAVNLLQIWVFPKERNIEPRYDQINYDLVAANNSFLTVVSPIKSEKTMWINQDAFFSLGTFDADSKASYKIQHPGNGAYVFFIEGQGVLDDTVLANRDAVGVYDTEELEIDFKKNSKVLIIEIPMQ
jgi:redox-sensitive bicupin YhaK (pirin superfamily)